MEAFSLKSQYDGDASVAETLVQWRSDSQSGSRNLDMLLIILPLNFNYYPKQNLAPKSYKKTKIELQFTSN